MNKKSVNESELSKKKKIKMSRSFKKNRIKTKSFKGW